MKTKITLLIAIFCIGFYGNAQTKVGTVDSDHILTKMPQLKQVQERLKKYGAKLDSINNVKIKDYDAKVKAYNSELKTLTEAAKKLELMKSLF